MNWSQIKTNHFPSPLLFLSSPMVELYLNPLSNPPSTTFTLRRHHRYHTRVRRSIHRWGRDKVLSTLRGREREKERAREKRERVPRPILDRNEANGRRIVGPGFRAGNFSYARFRGKNKTGCRKRNERTNERRKERRSARPSPRV